MTEKPYMEAMRRAQTCECGEQYVGDGGCPRCAQMDEVHDMVYEGLRDLRPSLSTDDILEAINEGCFDYFRD